MRYLKGTAYLISGALSAFYLFNPGAGVIEFIPDNIPGVGNIDEFIASLLLLNSLAYFGLDLRRKGPALDHTTTIES